MFPEATTTTICVLRIETNDAKPDTRECWLDDRAKDLHPSQEPIHVLLTAKIFGKVLPKTTGLSPGSGGPPEITWQDVLLALQGVRGKEEGFIRYVYMDDPRGRHDFFAGLLMEAMNRPEIQQWRIKNNKKYQRTGDIEKMVYMAMEEWRTNKRDEYGNPINENSRAIEMGVSRGVWARRYSGIYSSITAMPHYWLDEVMRLARKRL